jgi:hypothetical protein
MTKSTNGPFVLSRATSSDMDAIIDCEFRTFTDTFIREVFMGHDTPAGHANLSSHYQDILRTNPADVWIKVVEKATGKIVGASNWRVHMSSVPEHEEENLGWEWLEGDGEKMRKVKEVIREITETRRKLFTEPYCRELTSSLLFFAMEYLLRSLPHPARDLWLHDWSFLADSLTETLQNCTSALQIRIISAEVSDQ